MKISILKQVLKDAWRGFKLGYLSSRRDRYGYIHPTATVLQPCCCNKVNTYLYEHTTLSENTRIINSKGKFILKKYPPYTVIGGNPAKIIKYRFTLEEQIEHEKLIYPVEERLDPKFLKEIYEETNSLIHKK